MSVSNAEDEEYLSNALDFVESPRKSTVNEGSGRKSWSLIDRKTDQEVLQEMGVSILDIEDNDLNTEAEIAALMKNPLKRKHDIENVNPMTHTVSPKKAKFSPRSPRHKLAASNPGPSRGRSPRSLEKVKPLQPTDQNLLESSETIIEQYLIDEETPLGQSVPGVYLPASSQMQTCHSTGKKNGSLLGTEEEMIINRRSKFEPEGEDSFQVLSDEMILSVFRWLPKRTLANCMLVCKRWHQVACDETLWQRLDLGNKTLSTDALGRILRRKPIILRLASSDIAPWNPPALEPSRIQYLDLSMSTIEHATLSHLVRCCPRLRKLSLESVSVNDAVCQLIGQCSDLETLNLTMAQGLTEEGIQLLLQSTHNLQSLNISWCGLSKEALETLVDSLPGQLQRLNLAGARPLPDDLIPRLTARCSQLTELDLSDCPALGADGVRSLSRLHRLQHLALSRCYLLPPKALTKLNTMPSLQYLEVWGMLQTASLTALRAALPQIQVNQFMFSAIARPTVGTRRTSIWGLRTRD